MSIKFLISAVILVVFAVELYRHQSTAASRRLILFAAAVSAYELLHRQNFGIVVSLIVAGFALYAWRNWFVSLCVVVILMAFLENRDTPHGLAGIQGLNPWNFLMLNVLLSWWVHRRREGLYWDMPRYMVFLAVCYLFVVVWSYLRMADDYQILTVTNESEYTDRAVHYTFAWVTSEYLINCVKWLLPAILFYDACRTRERTLVALAFVLVLYFLIAMQVIECMPLRAAAASAAELARIAGRDLDRGVGYFRTELSMMLAGASWAILGAIVLLRKRRDQVFMAIAAALVALGQALTGGRAGYVTWGLTGLVLCILRWRRLLPLIPGVVVAVCLFLPSVRDRMLTGFTGSSENGIVHHEEIDEFAVTAGRTLAWSYVIPAIEDSPLIGYGRQAMIRKGIYQKILEDHPGETFPHPHNAYLEVLLDNGILGFFLIMPIYVVSLVLSLRLLRDRSDPLFSAVGGVAAALILGLMFASMGSQSFYAKESSVGMWIAIGLMLRVYLERKRSLETGEPLFGEESHDASEEHESTDPLAVPA
jgi:O-antigen ligase